MTIGFGTWRLDGGEKCRDWRLEAWRTGTVGSGVWRSDDGEKHGDRRMEACLDSFKFLLPFNGGHVASRRSTRDSPSPLLAAPLDFTCYPPPSIHLVGWLVQRCKSLMRKRCREGEMHDNWGEAPLRWSRPSAREY